MRIFYAAIICLIMHQAVANEQTMSFGGNVPCQTWLASAGTAESAKGILWILGFWSGMNVQSKLNNDVSNVGHTLDARAVSNAVEVVCRQSPSMWLVVAAATAWKQAKLDAW